MVEGTSISGEVMRLTSTCRPWRARCWPRSTPATSSFLGFVPETITISTCLALRSSAIADAMPLLRKAKQVEIVMVSGTKPKNDEVAGVDLGQHLARHGLQVEVKRITSPEIDVPSTILSY